MVLHITITPPFQIPQVNTGLKEIQAITQQHTFYQNIAQSIPIPPLNILTPTGDMVERSLTVLSPRLNIPNFSHTHDYNEGFDHKKHTAGIHAGKYGFAPSLLATTNIHPQSLEYRAAYIINSKEQQAFNARAEAQENIQKGLAQTNAINFLNPFLKELQIREEELKAAPAEIAQEITKELFLGLSADTALNLVSNKLLMSPNPYLKALGGAIKLGTIIDAGINIGQSEIQTVEKLIEYKQQKHQFCIDALSVRDLVPQHYEWGNCDAVLYTE